MSLLKKILVGMTVIVILLLCFSCTKEEHGIVEYEQFVYDYPDNYVDFTTEPKSNYNLNEEERSLIETIINTESLQARENMILELLDEDIDNQTFKAILLTERFDLYSEKDAELVLLEIVDEQLSEIFDVYAYSNYKKLYNVKLYQMIKVDRYVYDVDERRKLHNETVKVLDKLFEIHKKDGTRDDEWVYLFDMYNFLGFEYLYLGEYEKSFEAFEHLIEFDDIANKREFYTDDSTRYYEIARSAIRAGKKEEAFQYLKELEKLNEDYITYLEIKILYNIYYGSEDEVFSLLKELENYLGNHSSPGMRVQYYEMLFEAYHKYGDHKKAKQACEMILELAPYRMGYIIDMGYDVKYDLDLHELKSFYSNEFIEMRDIQLE